MSAIRVLLPAVAERIAAGEVIDRPAAVVKELLENAIDAGATDVRVEAHGGGLRLIRISDDGRGIPSDEVELAFRRHATSKLRGLDDLDRLDTFGFRGEALAAIAAVAEVTAISAEAGQPGVRCIFRAGRLLERSTFARSAGTTIVVHDLFSQMPARRKFMRGARGEAIQIGAVVRRYALAYPQLRFSLVLEGHHTFRSNGGDLPSALAAVFGEAVATSLFPIRPAKAGGAPGVEIAGVIGGALTHASRTRLSLFVNRRYVRPRALLAAVEEGYRPFLPRGRHPPGAIFLTVPPADLDVNVHPAKLDVRLREESTVAAALTAAVRGAFGAHPHVPSARVRLALEGRQGRLAGLRRIAETGAAETPWGDASTAPAGTALPPLRLVGQVAASLIVAESPDGLYLIDQHRAHELVIFDQMKLEAGSRAQALIEPAVLELPSSAAARLTDRLPALEALGLVCDPFGPGRFLVRSAPAGDGVPTLATSVEELLSEAAADREDWRERLLASLACHVAIRKGQLLGPREAQDLVSRLSHLDAPAVCPHGSPVLLHLSDPFLARQFGWG